MKPGSRKAVRLSATATAVTITHVMATSAQEISRPR